MPIEISAPRISRPRPRRNSSNNDPITSSSADNAHPMVGMASVCSDEVKASSWAVVRLPCTASTNSRITGYTCWPNTQAVINATVVVRIAATDAARSSCCGDSYGAGR